jgi:hypothetical protein
LAAARKRLHLFRWKLQVLANLTAVELKAEQMGVRFHVFGFDGHRERFDGALMEPGKGIAASLGAARPQEVGVVAAVGKLPEPAEVAIGCQKKGSSSGRARPATLPPDNAGNSRKLHSRHTNARFCFWSSATTTATGNVFMAYSTVAARSSESMERSGVADAIHGA